MICDIRKSFIKDAESLPLVLQNQLANIIEHLETAKDIREIFECKKLKGYRTAYRIKLKEYRIGFFVTKNSIELVRILHRKEIYKYFP